MLRAIFPMAILATPFVLTTAQSGCGPSCSGGERSFDGGVHTIGADDLVFESSTIDGPFLPFEGAAVWHFHHGLGVRPYQVDVTLSFADRPEDNGGSAASAGNLAIVLKTNDDVIDIKSDTCASYFIRVVAHAHPKSSTSDGGVDASPDTGADASIDTGPEVSDATDAKGD